MLIGDAGALSVSGGRLEAWSRARRSVQPPRAVIKQRYEVLETLGAGGEARVVRALDHQHDRVVALKIRTLTSEHDRAELLGDARILLALAPHPALPLVR